jgi:hypothetical protein
MPRKLVGASPKVDAAVKAKNRAKHVRATMKSFGYSEAHYQTMLAEQRGVCAICSEPPAQGEYLVIDHDHVGGPNGRLRGLLCQPCNKALGHLQDRPELCDRAAVYLRHHRIRHGRVG